LNTVSRYNYTLTDYAKNISAELQKILNEFNEIHEEILVFSSDIGMLYHADDTVIEVAMTEGRDIQKKVIDLNIKTSQFIRDIHSRNRPITDFIRYKKNHKLV
jgi:arginine decarboxylase-like protein